MLRGKDPDGKRKYELLLWSANEMPWTQKHTHTNTEKALLSAGQEVHHLYAQLANEGVERLSAITFLWICHFNYVFFCLFVFCFVFLFCLKSHGSYSTPASRVSVYVPSWSVLSLHPVHQCQKKMLD